MSVSILGRTTLIVTTTESGDGFDLDVTDFEEDLACCLHGTWVMNNEDLAAADSEPNIVFSYSGQLTAQYYADGTVSFLWADFMRTVVDNASAGGPYTSTDLVEGGGSQFYRTRFGELLVYEGPEITPTVTDGGMSFTALLDTGLGDQQTSQFYVCEEDSLVTTIRGNVDIEWTPLR